MNNRIHCYVTWLLATLLFAAAAITFWLSLNHPVSADLAMLHYSAWLINEKSFVLYRDIFELNFPLPFLFHSVFSQLFGYEALPLLIANGFMLMLLGVISWKLLAPISAPAAVFAPSLFTLLYLVNGGEYILEREFLCLLPAAAAVMLATSFTMPHLIKTLGTAIFAAIACSMKPNAVVMVPALLWILLRQQRVSDYPLTSILAMFFLAMFITACIPFLWATQRGSLPDFIQIYKSFVPIYASSRYDLFHYDSQAEQLRNLFSSYLKWGGAFLLLSAIGLGWAWKAKEGNRHAHDRIIQLGIVTVSFTFYEVLAGKFWTNHMFPSAYWTIMCFSLVLTTQDQKATAWKNIVSAILLIVLGVIAFPLSTFSLQQMQIAHQKELHEPDRWRARKIADFLIAKNLQPADTVQVLDMAGDGQAALLMATAVSATRHLIDVPLYMEPASPETQVLREEFIRDLKEKKPRFVVYLEQFLHPGGGNRLREFKPLAAMIEENYVIADQLDGEYIIFQRQTPATQ